MRPGTCARKRTWSLFSWSPSAAARRITTDEMRSILEDGDKLYTQLKIDDISNLGAVKIRIRSLMAAIDARKEN